MKIISQNQNESVRKKSLPVIKHDKIVPLEDDLKIQIDELDDLL